MKNQFKSLSALLLRILMVLACLAFAGQQAFATVAFTVTPSAISNTYAGPVTFQVTGLTNTETVVVQKYLVADGGGVIDATAILWQQFNLTDGQAGMVIGGVTNINVPGDTDGTANGQITATLYPGADFSQMFVAQYLFKLSSPVGHFAPITDSFAVTTVPYAQKFTGTVVSNGVAVPYASVVLFPGSGGGSDGPGNPVGGAVANNSGVYSLPAPVGTYTLVAFKTNFVASLSGAGGLVLSNAATLSTNLSLMAATETISGKFVDAANSSLGLPGMLFAVQEKPNLLAIGVTDTNGNFTTGVTPNQWGISSLSAALAFHGYVGPQNKTAVNATAGSVAGVTIALTKATALFYGAVKDSLGNPLSEVVAVEAYDNNNGLYQSDGYTATNGNYVTAAVGGLGNSDPWEVNVDNSSSFPNYIFAQPALDQNGGTNLNAGHAVLANITALLATNIISGNVSFNGANVSGVQVDAYATIGGNDYQAEADTDANGNYSFNVANGSWNVNVYDCGCSDSDSLNNVLNGVSYQDPASQNATINNDNAPVNFIVPAGGGSGQIFGYVTDTDNNPVTGVNVYASDGNGDNYSTTTDDNGYYLFNVANENWDVSVDCGGLTSLGYQCVSDQNVNVSSDSVEQDFNVPFAGSSGTLGITTATLPDGIVGGFYSQQLSASGGQSPYSWSLTPGSLALPGGISLSTDGILSGTPTNAPLIGTNYYFSVRVTDNQNTTADQSLSLTIYPVLMVVNSALPNGTNGKAYSAQIVASGGDNQGDGYSYDTTGTFPPGLNVFFGATTISNALFAISGTPTNSGTFSFTFIVYDGDFNEAQNNFSITVLASSLQISTASLSNATVGVAYTNQLLGSGGTLPYTWTIANGSQSPPAALTLSTGGLLAGVPAAGGTNSFIVRLTDHDALTTTRAFTLVVNPSPRLGAAAKISGTQFQFLLAGTAGQNYTLQMSTNLSTANWTSLFTTNSTTTNSFIVTDPNATNKQRYYRVLIGP